MRIFKEATIRIVKKNYVLSIDDHTGFTYSIGAINEWRTIPMVPVENDNTMLNLKEEGIYVLALEKYGVIDTAFIFYMPTLEECRRYIINMIICEDNICAPRHDCNNCDDLYHKWYKMLSEALIYYDKAKSLCDDFSIVGENKEDLEERLHQIARKIISITRTCEMCIKCEDRKHVQKETPVRYNVVKKSNCIPCKGGRR